MRYDRLFTRLFCEPLMLEDASRIGFERALDAFMGGNAPIPEAKKMDGDTKQYRADRVLEIAGRDALIHIDGAIGKHLSMMDMLCFGGCDLNDVDRALAMAQLNPDVRNVMLVVNSPGGTVTGVPETAARVAELASQKNVFAFTDGMCCSAAYYIASQADQIFSTASATVGSIGVYCALLDETRKMDREGTAVNLIKSGKYKGMGAPFQALSDEERKMLQARVDKMGAMFREAVTSKRPKVEADTMEGQSFFGDDALKARLVDGMVANLAAALSEF